MIAEQVSGWRICVLWCGDVSVREQADVCEVLATGDGGLCAVAVLRASWAGVLVSGAEGRVYAEEGGMSFDPEKVVRYCVCSPDLVSLVPYAGDDEAPVIEEGDTQRVVLVSDYESLLALYRGIPQQRVDTSVFNTASIESWPICG